MKPSILKHCAGRGYNSPLKQIDPPTKGEKSVEVGMTADKDTKSISPYLTASSGKFSADAGGNISPTGKSFNANVGYQNKGLSAGVGVESFSGQKPNLTARVSYRKTF
jgi:hypothetical protein